MATSPNYAWAEPDNSSLVKNGASDIRTLGDAIDTSLWNVGFGQAGKNKIINGDFRIWQRGTSFSNPASLAYTTDRFNLYYDGTGATRTISQQTFTPATAPVAGYEGAYFYRYAQSVAGTSNTVNLLIQPIEDVRVFAGQSVVLSFWAKADASRSITAALNQNFGSGGSSAVSTTMTGTASVTTSWQRFSFTVTIPSISGKTIGTSSSLDVRIALPAGVTQTIDIWGVQLEYGSKATPFQTATGTIQGELAACQRYYRRIDGNSNATATMVTGLAFTTSVAMFVFPFGTQMRVAPTSLETSNQGTYRPANATAYSGGTWSLNQTMPDSGRVIYTHGSAVYTAGESLITSSTTTSSYFAFNAEL